MSRKIETTDQFLLEIENRLTEKSQNVKLLQEDIKDLEELRNLAKTGTKPSTEYLRRFYRNVYGSIDRIPDSIKSLYNL